MEGSNPSLSASTLPPAEPASHHRHAEGGHTPGERVYSKGYRGFESHSLRQPVCGCRDFAPASRDHPRNSRAFAGSWERGTAESEPETASSGPIAGSRSRLSLLPSLAVRIRFRFAPQGTLEVRIPFAPPSSPRLRRLRPWGPSQRQISRHFAGFWASAFTRPKRRRPDGAFHHASTADFLRRRFRRFGKGIPEVSA